MSMPPPAGGPPLPPSGPGPDPRVPPAQPVWAPQQPWSAPPPRRGNGWKWALGAVALLAVIGVTVAVTLSVAGGGSGENPPTTSPTSGNGSNPDVASANDKGPATIITEDPTCAPVRPILETGANQQRNGWDTRDPSIPASAWTPAVRAQYEAVGQSMRSSADQMVPLVKLTPHRVMRELYEQFIAYSRAYADRIPTYTAADDNLALVANTANDAIGYMCAAISYESAPARGPVLPPAEAPSQVAPLGNPAEPQLFLTEPSPVCADWVAASNEFSNDTVAWLATNPDIPASQWTPDQRAINDAVAPVMSAFADKLQTLGERSGNPILQDFATLSAQYRRAYVQALPSYTPADKYLANAALKLGGVVRAACQAAEE
jgi:hypothetical protein